jgi:hypothetical protein
MAGPLAGEAFEPLRLRRSTPRLATPLCEPRPLGTRSVKAKSKPVSRYAVPVSASPPAKAGKAGKAGKHVDKAFALKTSSYNK